MLFADFGRGLGSFLAPILKTFEADCLVIGGNISGAYPLFGDVLNKTLGLLDMKVYITISELMESAAMVGSARLLDENFWKITESLISKI